MTGDAATPDAALLTHLAGRLSDTISGRVVQRVPIARFTSFRVGGEAAILVEPLDAGELAAVGEVLSKHDLVPLILGRGTNLLVSDDGFPGVVIRLTKGFEWIGGEGLDVEAGGATPLPQVANRAARRGLTGLEFTVAIPATVGGAVRMNAGAHGSSVADVLLAATICRLREGLLETVPGSRLEMGYRESSIEGFDVVCAATFRLRRGEPAEIGRLMEKYRAHRTATQPTDAPNAGSMFRNPPDAPAGALIDSAGLKGLRVGGAEVSPKHANFFLAHQGARAQDVYDLMAAVQRTVRERSGVELVPEIRLAGDFDRSAGLREAP